MIVSPRSRYSRSYATSDGTVRVQLPHVNTQKLSSTTRPCSSDSRSGRWVLSQLVLVSSGAGVPRWYRRRLRPATVPSEGFGSHCLEWGGPEVHAEPPAPDGEGAVPAQVEAGRQIVVLVADVALQCSQVNEPSLLCRGLALNIARRHEVHADVGTVGGRELGQPQDATAVK